VNIFENHFLDEFKIAQNNLAIANGIPVSAFPFTPNAVLKSSNFGNQGLPGQQNLPIITAAGITPNDATFAANLLRGQAGTFANSIASNSTRMAGLTKAGYPANFFIVNPTVVNGGAYLVTNGSGSTYNALQIELRRRLAKGLLVQGSYAFSKSLSNAFADDSAGFVYPTTLRNLGYDKGPSPWDIRHGFKLNYVYELPIGPGRSFLHTNHVVARKVLEGWQISGVSRVQSGSPDRLTGRQTANSFANSTTPDDGVVLYNMTAQQLNDMVKIRKTTSPTSGFGVVYYLPQDLIDNSLAAWEVGGKTLANLDPTKPYIAPQFEPGKMGYRIFLYGPWQARFDVSLAKVTKITESKSLEIRAQALNVANSANFLLGSSANSVNSGGITSTFGQTTSAYRDITVSGSSDPGGRIVEFLVRFRF
jgi:hypothetical protein